MGCFRDEAQAAKNGLSMCCHQESKPNCKFDAIFVLLSQDPNCEHTMIQLA
jgi:hypothetical protein